MNWGGVGGKKRENKDPFPATYLPFQKKKTTTTTQSLKYTDDSVSAKEQS